MQPMKFLLYQILAVGVIWIGMAFFFKELDSSSRVIFYIATSWLLLLVVLLAKQLIKARKVKE